MESIKQNPLEQIKIKVSQSIERAKKNPIPEDRLAEMESRLDVLRNDFLDSGSYKPENLKEENSIISEILDSSVLVDNITEYREVLYQIADEYGLGRAWADDLLAHENSHANVSQADGHVWVGYAGIFYKNNSGGTGFQPLHISKPDISWSPKELLEKSIVLNNAPEVYGNTLSEGDKSAIENDKERLKKIEEREKEDNERLNQLKSKLGI